MRFDPRCGTRSPGLLRPLSFSVFAFVVAVVATWWGLFSPHLFDDGQPPVRRLPVSDSDTPDG